MVDNCLLIEDNLNKNDCYINIVEGLLKRNQESLSDLYDISLSKIYGLALKITRRHDLAEEVVEDTYMQAWQEISKFDETRGPFIAWLLVICRSRAIDALRRLDISDSFSESEISSEQLDYMDSPLDILMLLERESNIHNAIKKLNAIQRQLIALAFFRGYTHDEIATNMHLPLGTVKSNLKRAQEKLRQSLINV